MLDGHVFVAHNNCKEFLLLVQPSRWSAQYLPRAFLLPRATAAPASSASAERTQFRKFQQNATVRLALEVALASHFPVQQITARSQPPSVSERKRARTMEREVGCSRATLTRRAFRAVSPALLLPTTPKFLPHYPYPSPTQGTGQQSGPFQRPKELPHGIDRQRSTRLPHHSPTRSFGPARCSRAVVPLSLAKHLGPGRPASHYQLSTAPLFYLRRCSCPCLLRYFSQLGMACH
jgi:hypothetical protein